MATVSIKKALASSAFFVCVLFHTAVCCADTVRAAKVLDGDSFRLTDGREVRLIGINAPEYGKDGKPNQPLAQEARDALLGLIAGRDIDLDYDAERQDRYGRVLAHAFVPGQGSVEEALLRDGFAFLIAQPPNLARLSRYSEAEAIARKAKRGVWGNAFFSPTEATKLKTNDTGFRWIQGRVQRVGRGKALVYLDLTPHVTLTIPLEHWSYFGGDPQRFTGQQVTARGWVTVHENRLRLRVSHPAMLETLN